MAQKVLARGGDWVAEGMNYEEFKRSGYSFALRYVVPSIPGKMVSALEVASAHAAKVDVGFVYETTGTTWQGGMTAGEEDGAASIDAIASIKAPKGIAVYHAVDSQVMDSEMPTVIQWVAGLTKSMTDYQVGVYGQFSVMQAIARAYPHVLLWQTPAWSSGGVYPALEIFQDSQVTVGAITLDTDSLLEESAGFWKAEITPPPPPSKGNDVDHAIAQSDWAYCKKCKGLFYKPEETDSKCPDGGTHDSSASGNYILTTITGTEPVE